MSNLAAVQHTRDESGDSLIRILLPLRDCLSLWKTATKIRTFAYYQIEVVLHIGKGTVALVWSRC